MPRSPDSLIPAMPASAYTASGCAYVAVYGTLRASGVNDIRRLAADVRQVGTTQLQGTLYDLGWYPGLRLHGGHPLVAEVYALNATLEQALDRIEGLWPHDMGEYVKRVVTQAVRAPDGAVQPLELLVYEATPHLVAGKPVIDAPDWLAWFAASGRARPEQFRLNSTRPPTA